MTTATLILVTLSLALNTGLFAALEALVGRTLAAVLCPVGWLGMLAAEGAIDAARGE